MCVQAHEKRGLDSTGRPTSGGQGQLPYDTQLATCSNTCIYTDKQPAEGSYVCGVLNCNCGTY